MITSNISVNDSRVVQPSSISAVRMIVAYVVKRQCGLLWWHHDRRDLVVNWSRRDSDRQIGRDSELDDRHLVFGHVEPCSEIQSTAARPTSELLGSRSHAPAPVASAVMYAEPIPRERSQQVGPAQSSNRPGTVKSG